MLHTLVEVSLKYIESSISSSHDSLNQLLRRSKDLESTGCLCWRALNRLHTGVGRAKTVMMRWGYLDDAQSVDCDCGKPQTMAHLLSGHSDRAGKGMRPQVGENYCVEDTAEAEEVIPLLYK